LLSGSMTHTGTGRHTPDGQRPDNVLHVRGATTLKSQGHPVDATHDFKNKAIQTGVGGTPNQLDEYLSNTVEREPHGGD
jgi:hypothetical protein